GSPRRSKIRHQARYLWESVWIIAPEFLRWSDEPWPRSEWRVQSGWSRPREFPDCRLRCGFRDLLQAQTEIRSHRANQWIAKWFQFRDSHRVCIPIREGRG